MQLIAMTRGAAMLVALSSSFVVVSGFCYYAMIGRVNLLLPEPERFPYLFTPPFGAQFSKPSRLFRAHRRLYPTSRLPLVCLLFWLAGVATGLIWFFWFAPAA